MDLSAVGLSGQVTISQVCAAIQDGWSFAAWNDTSLETCLSDAPDTYTLITIYRAAAPYVVCRAVRISDGMEYVGTWNPDREPNWTGWRQYATATPPQVHNLPILDGYSLGVDGAGYSKTQEGIVSVYFSVYGEFAASSSDIGGEAFAILPEGFRPTGKIPVPVVQQDIPGPDWVKVIVNPDGSMRYFGNGSTTSIYGSVSFVASA